MRNAALILSVVLLMQPFRGMAQETSLHATLTARMSFTTSALLYSNPDSPDPFTRAQNQSIDWISGGTLTFRIRPGTSPLYFALTGGYITGRVEEIQTVSNQSDNPRLPVTNGLAVVPFEATVGLFVPIHSEAFRLSFGTGFGGYYFQTVRKVVDVDAPSTRGGLGFSLVVEIHMELQVLNGVSISGEVRARDPEAKTENKYSSKTVFYQGQTKTLIPTPFTSKLNLDGICFGLGVAVDLF